jgi:hypothetical protein
LWERLGTIAQTSYIKEGYFWGMENTLGWVQNDTVGLELDKEGTEELVVLLGRTTEDTDVSKLKKQKFRTFTNLL